MSKYDDNFWDGFIHGWKHTGAHADGARMGELLHRKPNLQGEDLVPSGGGSLIGKVFFFVLMIPLFPFMILVGIVKAPFADNLRWPTATRIASIWALCSFIFLNISPDFGHMRKSTPDFLVDILSWSYVGILASGLVMIPAALFMMYRRR